MGIAVPPRVCREPENIPGYESSDGCKRPPKELVPGLSEVAAWVSKNISILLINGFWRRGNKPPEIAQRIRIAHAPK